MIIPSENIAKKINLVKNVFINLKVDNKDNSWNDKICIENLLPKYKYILVSIYNYISIIDIKYPKRFYHILKIKEVKI